MHRRLACVFLILPLGACQGWQSALDTHGPAASALEALFWTFLSVLGFVWVLTMGAVALSLRRRRPEGEDPLVTNPRRESRMGWTISGAVALTVVTVLTLTGLSYASQKHLFEKRDDVLTIKVTGHQWWWQVDYEDSQADKRFTTANEIHIPVGEPVLLKLESSDVIHSFWVPSLTGKMDLIPGRQNTLQIQADREGSYRGQCAEFCGWQHAHMGMLIVARPKAEFDGWRDNQIRDATAPQTDERKRGEQIFFSKPCVMCHQVRGTSAGGKVAPDLTHVGSRQYIAAGTLPTTRGNIAAWIVDPQSIKPGAQMPVIKIEPDELDPLVSYLEGLK
ncbi:cytochrome c oxidase subunit II [Microvirga subterranea]|uniref:Cytochrome aa3 subunit 2 n=1 Tax=Microvirga subterranea TaxID=186651 RepID=A0A370HTC7_9HYPH|nr:cytochrome c oxidase subunit II [Microvirga subterranea]RDI61211.1 cytochrome c oxidase subunit 2 [Microvirga subterranea]